MGISCPSNYQTINQGEFVGIAAFVLHTRPWRDTSLMVDWLTLDHGWITTVQRGARQIGKKSPPRPMAFHPLTLHLVGRGALKTATQIEPLSRPHWLKGQALAVGFYLNELLLRALHREAPVPELFYSYAQTLEALTQPAVEFGGLIRRFERALLDELGVGIDWQATADSGEAILLDQLYTLDAEVGILRNNTGKFSVTGRVLHAIAEHLPLETAQDRRSARDVMHYLLRPHVGSAVFHSRALWQSGTPPEGA
ncbi:MAG: DNA repair protein RecO [Halothiobacillus sp.]